MSSGVVLIYARVPPGLEKPEQALEAQVVIARRAAQSAGALVSREYSDISDGLEPGPQLRRMLDDLLPWGSPTVIVDRLARISKVGDEVRAVANRIHCSNGRLLSVTEPRAWFSSNPRWPISRGDSGPISSAKALAAAKFFGAMVAAELRVDDPLHFNALRGAAQAGHLRAENAIARLSIQSPRLPAPGAALFLIEVLSDGRINQEELTSAFGTGLVGELRLHSDLLASESSVTPPKRPRSEVPF